MKKVLSRTEIADYFGVSPQTVSNWADAGLIKRLNKVAYSGASVEKLAKEFADIPDVTQQIKDMRSELQELRNELSACRAEILLRHEAHRLSAIFANAYRVVAGRDPKSKDRSIEIVCSLLTKEVSIGQLAERYGVTVSRITQLAEKSIRHFAESVPIYEQLHEKVEEDKQVIDEQNLLISALEKQIEANNKVLKIWGIDIKDGKATAIATEEDKHIFKMLSIPLSSFNLSVRTMNITSFEKIRTVGDLIRCSKSELMRLRHFGKKSMWEIERLLDELNLHFGTDVDRIVRTVMCNEQSK